jgi:hypothetical protein
MVENLDDLKRACKASVVRSELKQIEVGDSVWITGRAAYSPEGTIALQQRGGHELVVAESAVLEVEQREGLFMVRIGVGTNVLVKMERVLKVTKEICSCKTGEPPASNQSQTIGERANDTGYPLVCDYYWLCFYEWPLDRWICRAVIRCGYVGPNPWPT